MAQTGACPPAPAVPPDAPVPPVAGVKDGPPEFDEHAATDSANQKARERVRKVGEDWVMGGFRAHRPARARIGWKIPQESRARSDGRR